MKKILIAGGSGMIGRALTKLLNEKGYNVYILSRNKSSEKDKIYHWNPEFREIDSGALKNVNIIINLAGSGVADKRWTESYRKEIYDSRINPGNFILSECRKQNIKLDYYVSSSATGYYGSKSTEHIFKEEDKAGNDFLADVCVKWEAVSDEYSDVYEKRLIFRTGVVLSNNGGALNKVLPVYKLMLGSPLGSGNQYMPWIHISDLAKMFHYSIENNLSGIYNAVSPQHLTNKEYSDAISNTLNVPKIAPKVPAFILKIVFSEMADILLEGSRVSSEKIEKEGFVFSYPDIDKALANLLHKS